MDDFTIDFVEIEIPCPQCSFSNPVWMRQVRLREAVICRGCKSNLKLEDHMNTVRKAERSTRHAIDDLRKSLDKLSSKLTIRL